MPAWLNDDPRPLDWNGPVDRGFTRFGAEALDRPVIETFESVALRHRERIAIRDGRATLTFGEIWDGVSGLAETLAGQTQPGDLIGVLLPAGVWLPLTMLASLAAGRPFVVLDPHYPREWLDRVLEDAQPALLVTHESCSQGVQAKRVIQLEDWPVPARAGWQPARLGVDEPACVLFTSGSSGRPKGIVNSQRNLLQRVAQSINAAHVNAEDRFLTLASPCTIVGVRDLLTALLAGASVRLFETQGAEAREILNVIRAERITILFALPALLRSVLAANAERAHADLRLVRLGGDTTPWSDFDLLREWLAPGAAIQVIYAATEAPMLQWFVDESCRGDDARIPIGYPLPGNRLALDSGELVVSSEYVALGRWVNGRCVTESSTHVHREFRTGDLVRQRPDGLLERLGRKDRQAKIRGARVDLDGVEAALRRHPRVRDVAAVARTNGADGTSMLVAYVCTTHDSPARLIDELRESMRSVPSPMRPARFYVVDEIPRLPSSKLDIARLNALDDATCQSERTGPALKNGDSSAQTVARVWAKVLHKPVRAADEDFFEAGGDSLQAMTFTVELERALDLRLSPTLLNEAPRFADLCATLRERRAPRESPLISLKSGSGGAPLFLIHGLGGHIANLLPMARRMAYRGEVIGIRARGLAHGEATHSSVEAMATDYLAAIKARQPNGPYHLAGYSFGGLVAFEIARRLSESGDDVGLVGLFDTRMSPLRWPLRASLSVIARRIVRSQAPPLRALPALMRVLKVAACALCASARYRPGFYPATLTLFTPVERERALPSIEAMWRPHARALSVVETEGDHATMLARVDSATLRAVFGD